MKTSVTSRSDLGRLAQAWRGIRATVPDFGPIRSKRAFERMSALMNVLLDEVGDDEDHPLADLLDVVSTLVMQYEEANEPKIESADPREILRFLMEQHELRQTDLAKEVGGQGVVSEILAGKRDLNARQIRALAKRFSVSPAVFIPA